jgi:hypothetical protein
MTPNRAAACLAASSALPASGRAIIEINGGLPERVLDTQVAAGLHVRFAESVFDVIEAASVQQQLVAK